MSVNQELALKILIDNRRFRLPGLVVAEAQQALIR